MSIETSCEGFDRENGRNCDGAWSGVHTGSKGCLEDSEYDLHVGILVDKYMLVRFVGIA
jgi:hypothetical protein